MDVEMAHAIEAAESEYLCSRVESLSRVSGNPFGARVFFNDAFPCFQVKASPSPMLNRIYGDSTGSPQSLLSLLKESAEYSTVTPLIGKASTLGPYAFAGEGRLERLRGWTHLQLACSIDDVVLNPHSFEIEEATSQTLPEFAAVHASGFHTKPEHLQLSQDSFAGLMSNERLKIYVLKSDGQVVAGALMYLATNGVAYLGTAATRKNARGLGFHAALIAHRIEQAKKYGSLLIAATALPSSQSRRNLQRAGLATSHAQALYRLADTRR
ncbi:GNAT family N-acetyltransferase [Pseudomonas sp. SWRI18]|uniref:GNAT family N-acetyltransferase n=1 Tax=Pseudomonas sp. SWRI18 TaxID=2753888 RepID=UPI0016490FDB|nr:GNAT family N-acetyltransferase [Pseudomonas sp. SWRI18]MBC3303091.1 GNAT family N-acetyltransferase [Pseudomonas sp. SWRI18]